MIVADAVLPVPDPEALAARALAAGGMRADDAAAAAEGPARLRELAG